MAKVLKSYELREMPDGKVALMVLNSEGIMVPRIAYAKLVENYENGEKLPESVGGNDFFVLKKGETFILCWVKNAELQTMTCNEFQISHGLLLLKWDEENWYWWKKDDLDKKPCLLGKQVLKYGPAFIHNATNRLEFVYFDEGELKRKSCQSYEVLKKEINFSITSNIFIIKNVLKLNTVEGAFFVSIKKLYKKSKWRNSKCEPFYQFVFTREEYSTDGENNQK